MIADLRYAVRSLGRAYGFTLVVVITLALGIGAAAAIFSVADWVLFKMDPYPEKNRLCVLGWKSKESSSNPFLFGFLFQTWRGRTDAFSGFAAAQNDAMNVLLGNEPVLTAVQRVSPDCFATLGFPPVLGRGFLPEEFRAGNDNVAVISDGFWRMHFAGRPDVLGREIQVGREICKIVGVLPARAQMPIYSYGDVFRPLVLTIDPAKPWFPILFVVGRLKPGVTAQQAEAALAAAMAEIPSSLVPQGGRDLQPQLFRLDEIKKVFHPEIYWVLLGAVAFLYAIACLNATNLMLVRVLGKRRELSIRLALGSGRREILRLLLVESTGLSLAAAAAGVLVAYWVFPLLLRLARGSSAVGGESGSLNWRVLGVIGALGVLTSVLIAVIPAARILRADINEGLKEGGTALGESRRLAHLRGALVVAQAAFAVVLLSGAGLMVRTLQELQRVDLGFEAAGRVKVHVQIPDGHRAGKEDRLRLFQELQQRLQMLPGVRDAAFGSDALLAGYSNPSTRMRMPDGAEVGIERDDVTADFRQTAGLTLVKGRWLQEKRDGTPQVVINETLARRRFGEKDPIGQMIAILLGDGKEEPWQVIGVVRDIRATMRSAPGMHVYCGEWWWPPNLSTFVLRLARDPGPEFEGLVRRAIYDFDPLLLAWNVQSINSGIDGQLWTERLTLSVLQVLSGFALVLAVVGLFSVLAYTVDRRMGEFGVRLALGATPADLTRLVMVRGITLTALGAMLGVAGALGLTRFLQSLLYETAPFDPAVYLAVAAALLAAGAAACWLPARRAARTDVARLLRTE